MSEIELDPVAPHMPRKVGQRRDVGNEQRHRRHQDQRREDGRVLPVSDRLVGMTRGCGMRCCQLGRLLLASRDAFP